MSSGRGTSQVLRRLLVCPSCQSDLIWEESAAQCAGCGLAYAVEEGIPVLLSPSVQTPFKMQQAVTHDTHWVPDFEVTRPWGAALFYGLLMEEKFRHSVSGISDLIPGATALTVCGGSGMDAEFLARAGAAVIATDISTGACRRTRRRSMRLDLPILPVVADVERLPLRARSVDVAYVHDGLHHLEDPFDGLTEMARVAAQAVSITEPAAAAVTRLAVRLGLADEEEDAGNRIGRLDPAVVASRLQRMGWEPVDPHRYGMFYRHSPGPLMRMLSRRRLSTPALWALRRLNDLGGRLGNKMTVQARRPS